jgi:hypothetical protein
VAGRVIEDHLDALAAALTVPPRVRRRVLAEARDHLLCATEQGRADGLGDNEAQAAAVRDHGPPALIARRYAEALAHGAAQLATVAGLAAVIAFAALAAVATQISPVHASGPADAITWFAVQIAVTCAALSTVRALRHRLDPAVPSGKLRLINRGWGVAVGAVLVSLGATLADGYSDGAAGAPWRTALTIGAAVATAAATVALASLVLSARRTRELAGHADEPAGDDALDDFRALALSTAGRLLPAGTTERAEALARHLAAHRAVRAVALRTHPWRFCALVALAAGATVAVTHIAGEGPATSGLLVTLAVAAVLVAIEACAIAGCFALLGGFLGIRGGYRSPRSA